MCLAVPVLVISVDGPAGVVDAGGNRVRADLTLVEGVRPGDYVILHAGFAIQKYSPEEAEETLRLFQEMVDKAAELEGNGPDGNHKSQITNHNEIPNPKSQQNLQSPIPNPQSPGSHPKARSGRPHERLP